MPSASALRVSATVSLVEAQPVPAMTGLRPATVFDGGLHEPDALVEGAEARLAGGAGDDEAVAEVVLDEVFDQFGVAPVVDLLVFAVRGVTRGQQDLAVCFAQVHGWASLF